MYPLWMEHSWMQGFDNQSIPECSQIGDPGGESIAKPSLDGYRHQGPRVGGVLAMALGGALALTRKKLSGPQLISGLNWGALFVHQYEEYQDPGYFPGQMNRGVYKSDHPENYPLNADVAMWINTAIAYPFYALPILFPKRRWLGIAPALFGMGQALGHGIIFPRRAGARYSPGFLASFLLHVPLGIAYFRTAKEEDGSIPRSTWLKGIAYTVAFAVLGVAFPNQLASRVKDSPYRFRPEQVGPYAVKKAAE